MAVADDYLAFLAGKAPMARAVGLTAEPELARHLFPYQRHCAAFLLRIGRGGLYLDTGLGKTACQLEWARHAAEATNGKALILTPLAVARQIEREARRWGYEARVIREQREARGGISICNYDRLDRIDPDAFGAVSLDESSIIKNFTGKTSRALIVAFAGHRFKLAATATPAPNDHMELGQQAEFLSVMAGNEMLSRFFINDSSTASQEWRLKGHAVEPFWDWMASWSRMASMPSDLGDSDEGFVLPPLKVIRHRSESDRPIVGEGLFGALEISATDMHRVKRQTVEGRAAAAAACVVAGEPCVIWCDTDYESEALARAIPDAAEIRGSHSIDRKEETLDAFAAGRLAVLISKPSITGFGVNWQHCARMIFVGRSFSYEAWYQAVRRCWRFGQTRPVECHLIVAEGEDAIGRVIDRKAEDHAAMKIAMRAAMARVRDGAAATRVPYQPTHEGRMPGWLSAA